MLKVYLAGEIHSDWREEIIESCKKEKLDIIFEAKIAAFFFLQRILSLTA